MRAGKLVDGPLVPLGGSKAVAARLIERLDGATSEVLIMYGLPPMGISKADTAVWRALGRGIKVRSLYPEERAVPETLRFLERYLRAGERVRFGHHVPTRLAIFDHRSLIVALALSEEPARFYGFETEHAEMIRVARAAFEYAWKEGWEYIPPAKKKSSGSRTI